MVTHTTAYCIICKKNDFFSQQIIIIRENKLTGILSNTEKESENKSNVIIIMMIFIHDENSLFIVCYSVPQNLCKGGNR